MSMSAIEEMEQRGEDYAFAREILRYAIERARDWDEENVLSVLQEALYLAHSEVTEELGYMREELIELGLTPEELDKEVQADDEEDEE